MPSWSQSSWDCGQVLVQKEPEVEMTGMYQKTVAPEVWPPVSDGKDQSISTRSYV